MNWQVITTALFDEWFDQQDRETQKSVLVALHNLSGYGPNLGRPYADTVYSSKFTNMKELRIQHQGKPIRAFYAFDPKRKAIVLCAGDKTGDNRFYKRMITIADEQYQIHLDSLRRKI